MLCTPGEVSSKFHPVICCGKIFTLGQDRVSKCTRNNASRYRNKRTAEILCCHIGTPIQIICQKFHRDAFVLQCCPALSEARCTRNLWTKVTERYDVPGIRPEPRKVLQIIGAAFDDAPAFNTVFIIMTSECVNTFIFHRHS